MATYAPRHVDIWPWTKWYSATAGFTRSNGSGQLGMGTFLSTSTVNNEIVFHVALDAGTWTVTVIYSRDTNRGIGTVYLDSTSLGTIDFYNATGANNQVTQLTGITVASAGVYALKIKVESKNASSGGYYQILNLITLTRTGA